MKKYIRYSILGGIALLWAGSVSSCDDDDAIPADQLYYELELSPNYVIPCEGLDPSAYGNGYKTIIRANGHWVLEPVSDESDWLKIYPMEGDDDGYLRFYAAENTRAAVRSAEYRVVINGTPQENTFAVSQQAAQPFLTLTTAALIFKRTGGELSVGIDSNVDWEYNISGDGASAFTASSSDPTTLTVKTTGFNETGADITATLTVAGTGSNSGVSRTVDLTQLYATFFEDFSWLESQSGVLGWKTNVSETRIDKWSAAEKSHGWTSLSTWLYSRTGFVKFGKGGYGGDLASPNITEITGSANVSVSWNALGYSTPKNVHDDLDYFFAGVLGPGRITGASSNGETGSTFLYKDGDGNVVTLEAVRYDLGDKAWFDPINDPTGTQVWLYPEALFSIQIEGFTSDSKVVFMTGTGTVNNSLQNDNAKNSRIFLDNFKVVEN